MHILFHRRDIEVVIYAILLYQREMIDLIFGVERHFQEYFSYIMATSFRGGRSRSTRREPPIMGK
jgi:hypothetical protein